MKTIVILPAARLDDADDAARLLLTTWIADAGCDVTLQRAVRIAYLEDHKVQFQLPNGSVISPELAYNIIFERGLSLRTPSHDRH